MMLVSWWLAQPVGAQHRFAFFENPTSPYTVHWKADAFLSPSAVLLGGTALLLKARKPSAVPGSYQRSSIWTVDRFAVKPYSPSPALASDVVTYSAMGMPALLLISKQIRRDKSFYLMWGEVVAINASLTYFTKTVANRPRPYAYHPQTGAEMLQGKEPLRSFFSGHTSFAAASMFFMAKVYADYHPQNKWRFAMWSAAATVPAVLGLLRVRAGKHFPTDVAVGYAVGAATGYLVPLVHQKLKQRQLKSAPATEPEAY
jgi:membrane-associated phospholipid phosphatase